MAAGCHSLWCVECPVVAFGLGLGWKAVSRLLLLCLQCWEGMRYVPPHKRLVQEIVPGMYVAKQGLRRCVCNDETQRV